MSWDVTPPPVRSIRPHSEAELLRGYRNTVLDTDEEDPLFSMSFRFKVLGGHTWVRVFMGVDADHRAKLGELTFRNEEWAWFRSGLEEVDRLDRIEFVDESDPI